MKVGLTRFVLRLASAYVTSTCSLAADAEVHVFNIPAGDGEDSIAAFSQQAQRLIAAPGDALLKTKSAASPRQLFSPRRFGDHFEKHRFGGCIG